MRVPVVRASDFGLKTRDRALTCFAAPNLKNNYDHNLCPDFANTFGHDSRFTFGVSGARCCFYGKIHYGLRIVTLEFPQRRSNHHTTSSNENTSPKNQTAPVSIHFESNGQTSVMENPFFGAHWHGIHAVTHRSTLTNVLRIRTIETFSASVRNVSSLGRSISFMLFDALAAVLFRARRQQKSNFPSYTSIYKRGKIHVPTECCLYHRG